MKKNQSTFIKLPGLVDVHTHLREPGATQKEDFNTGTMAAVAGGYTQILDMPNNTPPTTTEEELNKKINLAKNRIWCDLGFNFGATAQSTPEFKNVMHKTFGLKVYMGITTGPLLINDAKEKEKIFKSWESPLPIMVHVEGEGIAEAINLAKKFKKRLHICHVTGDQLKFIKKAKAEKVAISCEVTPHHLFLEENDVKKLGALGIMKPPLGNRKSQSALWGDMNVIDMIATDHAPHTIEEKGEKIPPFGVPGLETTLPLLLNAVFQGRISMAKLIDLTCTKPREIFKLPTQKDTYVLVNIEAAYKIGSLKLFTKCGWTPFGNLEGRGQVSKVVLRNKTIFEGGKFIGKPMGKIMEPQIN